MGLSAHEHFRDISSCAFDFCECETFKLDVTNYCTLELKFAYVIMIKIKILMLQSALKAMFW